jgi:hypothetical protein
MVVKLCLDLVTTTLAMDTKSSPLPSGKLVHSYSIFLTLPSPLPNPNRSSFASLRVSQCSAPANYLSAEKVP